MTVRMILMKKYLYVVRCADCDAGDERHADE
jgi:hypothetical protein